MMLHSPLSHHHIPKLVVTFLILINHVTVISSTTRELLQSSSPSSPPSEDEANTDFIKTSCGSTTYPDLCFTTLSVYAAKIQTSPRLLAMTSLSEAFRATRSTAEAISGLSESRRVTAREAAALTDCAEELGDTADELRRSIAEMGEDGPGSGPEFRLQMSNIQTWVSAALTDEDTCVDGFSGSSMNGSVKTEVRERIVTVAHMTSNALALVNHFAVTNE